MKKKLSDTKLRCHICKKESNSLKKCPYCEKLTCEKCFVLSDLGIAVCKKCDEEVPRQINYDEYEIEI